MQTDPRQQLEEAQTKSLQRAVGLQIYLPLALGVTLVIGVVALGLIAGGRGGATTSAMADAALVALLLPMMLLGVLMLAAILALVVGLAWLIGWLPERARVVQQVVIRAPALADRVAGRAAQVVLAPRSAWAAIRAAWAWLVPRG